MLHSHIAPLLLGHDPGDIERIWNDLYHNIDFQVAGGAEMRALSAVDLALWDLLGNVLETPVYRLIGGRSNPRVRLYNTCFPQRYDFNKEPDRIMQELIDRYGIRAIKIWPFDGAALANQREFITPAQIDAALRPVRILRDRFGMSIEILMEFHSMWNLTSAIRIAQALEPYQPMWLEDMLMPGNYGQYAELARATRLALTLSERMAGKLQFESMLESRAAKFVMFDVCWCGGLTEARKITALADAHQLPFAPHTAGGPLLFYASTHLSTAMPNLWIQEELPAVLRIRLAADAGESFDAESGLHLRAGIAGLRNAHQARGVGASQSHSPDHASLIEPLASRRRTHPCLRTAERKAARSARDVTMRFSPMRILRPLSAALCACCLLQAALTSSEQQLIDSITPAELRAHVSFLAADALEGRDTPSMGLNVAAEYIASEFRRVGLEPAGDDGYFQTASFKGAKVRNVAAILRGSDSRLNDTWLLVSAHYDHIGTKGTGPEERIYNGANDDASGTSSMLALAEAFARLSERPKRSLLFIAYYGEEKGLVGSRYYAAHPLVPLARTEADLNLEHMGRTDDTEGPSLRRLSVTGFDYSDLTAWLKAAGQETGVTVYRHAKTPTRFSRAATTRRWPTRVCPRTRWWPRSFSRTITSRATIGRSSTTRTWPP